MRLVALVTLVALSCADAAKQKGDGRLFAGSKKQTKRKHIHQDLKWPKPFPQTERDTTVTLSNGVKCRQTPRSRKSSAVVAPPPPPMLVMAIAHNRQAPLGTAGDPPTTADWFAAAFITSLQRSSPGARLAVLAPPALSRQLHALWPALTYYNRAGTREFTPWGALRAFVKREFTPSGALRAFVKQQGGCGGAASCDDQLVLLASMHGTYFQTDVRDLEPHYYAAPQSPSPGLHRRPMASFSALKPARKLYDMADDLAGGGGGGGGSDHRLVTGSAHGVCMASIEMDAVSSTNAFYEVLGADGVACAVLLGLEQLPPEHSLRARLQQMAPAPFVSEPFRQLRLTDNKVLSRMASLNLLNIKPKQRVALAKQALPPQPRRSCPPTRNLMMAFGDYSSDEVWYRLLRSLREAGATCDAVIFTKNTSPELEAIVKR
jgi:hypothetical protein